MCVAHKCFIENVSHTIISSNRSSSMAVGKPWFISLSFFVDPALPSTTAPLEFTGSHSLSDGFEFAEGMSSY